MTKQFSLAAALAVATAASVAGAVRQPAAPKMTQFPPYPPAAQKKGIEGNVVLTGEVTPAGTVSGLRPLASSSEELTPAALSFVSNWKFTPATEDGRPVATILNAIVRFRKDRGTPGKDPNPGNVNAAIVGDISLRPVAASGRPTNAEGFPVEPGDTGIFGRIDLDFPKTFSQVQYHVVAYDSLPNGTKTKVADQTVSAGGSPTRAAGRVEFQRKINPADRAEMGLHAIEVFVEGKNAGGGRYRVGR